MTATQKIALSIILIVLGVLIAAIIYALIPHSIFGAAGLLDENRTPRVLGSSCQISTSSPSAVGPGIANQQLLGTSTNRAWASIEILPQATSSVLLGFNSDIRVSTSSVGMTIGSSTDKIVNFGLATRFPYTGSVQGQTTIGSGSTTVLVTQCDYFTAP